MSRRTGVLLVAAATLLGAVLRLPGLDTGLWYDEIVTLVESVRPPLLDVITAFPGSNNHPLYSVLAHLSIVAFGDHAWTLRLPAYLFGVASIPAVYVFGQQVTTRLEAALGALVLAVAYHGVWFSQNARGYTALLFFTLLATGLVIRLLRTPERRTAVAYGVVVGLGIYTHLTMAFIAAGHTLVWAWTVWQAEPHARQRHLREGLTAGFVAAGVAVLLYAPTLGQVLHVFTAPPPPAAAVATPKWAVAEALRGLQIGFGAVGVLCALMLGAIGGLSYLRKNPQVTMLFVLSGPITVLATVGLGAPLRPRFFFSLAGFGVLILVRGAMDAGRAVQRWMGRTSWPADAVGIALVGVLSVASLYSLGYNYRYPKQDFDGAMAFVDARRGPTDVVATGGLARYTFEHYRIRPWTPMVHAADFERLTAGGTRVWAIYSFPIYMDISLMARLERDCHVQGVFAGTLGGGDVIVCATTGRTQP